MTTYKLAEVSWSSYLHLACTHAQDAEEVLAELKGKYPWRVEPYGYPRYDDWTSWRIFQCENKDWYGLWWVIRQLCMRGWEPIGVTGQAGTASGLGYLFRKIVED